MSQTLSPVLRQTDIPISYHHHQHPANVGGLDSEGIYLASVGMSNHLYSNPLDLGTYASGTGQLDTPSPSTEGFASPAKYGFSDSNLGASGSGSGSGSRTNGTYLPTPTSALPHPSQQSSQQPYNPHSHIQHHQASAYSNTVMHSPSPQSPYVSTQSSPTPANPHQQQQRQDWNQANAIAGPSSQSKNRQSSQNGPARNPREEVEGHDHGHVVGAWDDGSFRTNRSPDEVMMLDGLVMEDEGDGRVGVEEPVGERQYTELKCVGDGSFGTVWLCDWHSPVKSDVLLSAMQCGAGARPEWAGKRLVALKRMKRVWEGGWDQAKTLGELVSLRKIPSHPAIIPLYDAFISPKSRELYFVFECMEGNLYQLTKSRRGRPLAAGLVASCFHQISSGLHHIHQHGYFHRDMKPENLLVTTTGLTDYLSASALAQLNAQRAAGGLGSDDHPPRTPNGGEAPRYEKDVAVIVKLADFGLARATSSRPPYTEYVSTRWYRAPEVLLRSTEYGAPVDMWALGTILSEMVNLKPLFPGVSEIDQVYRICDTLGDPSSEYGVDKRGRTIGGGSWNSGIKLAKNVGFSFPKRKPVRFRGLFADSVPQSLVDCISECLRYNPKYRMTSSECVDHPYFHETLPHLHRAAQLPRIPFSQGQPAPGAHRPAQADITAPPRQLPPSHSHHEPRAAFANGDMRTLPPPIGTPENMGQNGQRLFFPSHHSGLRQEDTRILGASALVHQLRELDLPTEDLSSYGHRAPPSPVASSVYSFGGDRIVGSVQPPAARQHRWDDPNSHLQVQPSIPRRTSNAQSIQYDGSVFAGSQDASSSTPSFTNFQSLSISNLQRADQYAPHIPNTSNAAAASSVAAFVQQQQQQVGMYVDEMPTPRQQAASSLAMPPIETPRAPAPVPTASKLGVTGKKKKWGLSSVFGGGEKSHELGTVDEGGYQTSSSSSLKRTQSGGRPSDRITPTMTTIVGGSPLNSLPSPTIELDPKKAKKEAERQARELEKAKREAAERAQKERARAVLNKRNQLIEARRLANTKTEIEYGDNYTSGVQAQPRNAGLKQGPILGSLAGSSSANLSVGSQHSPSNPPSAYVQQQQSIRDNFDGPRDMREYRDMPGSQSVNSVRSHHSHHSTHSNHSGHGQLSAAALQAFSNSLEAQAGGIGGPGPGSRHKARRRDEDDDHSMSSFDRNSLMSRSVLTVGTVDSDPGPRRTTRQDWPDPTLAHRSPKRTTSVSSFKPTPTGSHQAMMSRSNPSLESQLARDFQVQAVVASSSSTSLGRHGASQLSLNGESGGLSGISSRASAPTSPYGHAKGIAVAHGAGMGRSGTILPSISSWEAAGDAANGNTYGHQINPMFRVPPTEQQKLQHQLHQTTLPPFSAIASVADTHQQLGHSSSPRPN